MPIAPEECHARATSTPRGAARAPWARRGRTTRAARAFHEHAACTPRTRRRHGMHTPNACHTHSINMP
eukprot:941528-Lingulodinium_polyedra.AAC.1